MNNFIEVHITFKGFLIRKFKRVTFHYLDEEIAEFKIHSKDKFIINFKNSNSMTIDCTDSIGLEYVINNLRDSVIWKLSNSHKEFSFHTGNSKRFINSDDGETIIIKPRGKSNDYSSGEKTIGKTSYKLSLLKKIKNIEVLDMKYKEILIASCCIEIIKEYYYRLFETID